MSVPFVTYHEVIAHLVDFVGADVSREAERDARRAIQDGYREYANRHRWCYFYAQGRLATVASYTTGTIAYVESTRQVTLTDGTWPSWAKYGVITISDINYDIDTRVSDTVLTLVSSQTPGDDIDAGTSYTLYRDTFPTPEDLISIDEIINRSRHIWVTYTHPRSWLNRHRVRMNPGVPNLYTLRGDPNYAGRLGISFYPAPDTIYQLDYLYQRRPRPLVIDEVSDGTVTLTSASTTVTGSGTSWSSRLVGSVIRLSADTSNLPDGLSGANPYRYERLVTDVASATSLTLDSVTGEDLTGVKYRISDPVDIEPGAMHSGFLRCAEYKMAIARQLKNLPAINKLYESELILAKEADSRSMARRAAGEYTPGLVRLAHMPTGPDLG